ncbi:MAG: tRNA dihydrouridine synthase DusB [Clostridia bacterium]|nr:tRNA dihydrouridine synthase DusB [Clostridia bacterium]
MTGQLALAPLAGISDAPFRRICHEMGAAYTCSEMVSAKGLYYGDRKSAKLLTILPGEGPVGFQIFGHEPEIMADSAMKLDSMGNAFLDVNMGCPVPKIVGNHEGSYLMKDPDLCFRIVETLVKAVSKLVTVKIRAGWDKEHINCVEVARACEAAGAARIAVHGRTREQFYSGRADWSVIRAVKDAVSVPVAGNGDVFTYSDGLRMMDETGCDVVLVGRGALGNPWIFTGTDERPSSRELMEVMLRHLNDEAELKGEHVAVLEMRKHVGWYLKGREGAAAMRQKVNCIKDIDELREVIEQVR